jgi:predicted transcriptional regulator YdeE
MQPRLEEWPEFTVLGVVRTFTPQTMAQIPQLWEEFAPRMDSLPGREGKRFSA